MFPPCWTHHRVPAGFQSCSGWRRRQVRCPHPHPIPNPASQRMLPVSGGWGAGCHSPQADFTNVDLRSQEDFRLAEFAQPGQKLGFSSGPFWALVNASPVCLYLPHPQPIPSPNVLKTVRAPQLPLGHLRPLPQASEFFLTDISQM